MLKMHCRRRVQLNQISSVLRLKPEKIFISESQTCQSVRSSSKNVIFRAVKIRCVVRAAASDAGPVFY